MIKFSLIFILTGMISFTLHSGTVSDTLSLDSAMQLAIKNNYGSSQDSNTIAECETELLSSISSSYFECLYYRQCYDAILNTKDFFIKELSCLKIGDNTKINLNIQSLISDMEIKAIEYQINLSKCKSSLYDDLQLDNSKDYFLSTPFETTFTVFDTAIVLPVNPETRSYYYKNRKLYQMNVDLVQQLNIKKQLVKKKLKKQITGNVFDYSELKRCIDEYIEIQLNYFSKLLEVKKLYINLTKFIAMLISN